MLHLLHCIAQWFVIRFVSGALGLPLLWPILSRCFTPTAAPRERVLGRALAIHYFTVLIIIFPLLRVGLSFRYIVCCFLVWLMANARFFCAFWSRIDLLVLKFLIVMNEIVLVGFRAWSCVVGLVRARKQHRSTVDHRSIKRSRVCWLMFCEVILKLSFFFFAVRLPYSWVRGLTLWTAIESCE